MTEISRNALGEACTCSRTIVYRHCKQGGMLVPALTKSGNIELNHPAAKAFCEKYGFDESVVENDEHDGAVDPHLSASAYIDMTAGEIVSAYGTQSKFKKMADAIRSLVITRGHEEAQARKRGELIHTSEAQKLVDMVDGLHKQLLTDAVTSIALVVQTQVKADAGLPEIEQTIQDSISRIIKLNKNKMIRALRDV